MLYPNSSPFTKSFGSSDWEIILTGKNAVVAKLVDFGADLFYIEYVYLAAPGREFADAAAVDRPGIRIAVPRNASADVYLSKALKGAELASSRAAASHSWRRRTTSRLLPPVA